MLSRVISFRPHSIQGLCMPPGRLCSSVTRKHLLVYRLQNVHPIQQRMMSSSSNTSTGVWRRLWIKYNYYLEEQPLITKMVSSTVLAVGGDLICQLAFEDKEFSLRRTVEVGSLGCFLIGPVLHCWYGFLATFIPGRSWTSILKRLLMDQFIFAPTFVATVFVYMATIQGKADEIQERLTLYWPEAIVANWKLWIPAQMINFSLMPLHFQVIFANFVSVIWNGYLSWATNRNLGDNPEELKEMVETKTQENQENED
eukprot:gb/GECG01010550.1/.p1 GENE.gb/GECG01010550.1/~~gb/GECG01010550.1/.p1  ORF type:complete len:256 (+),score=17.14 gb/GECG01010550.1/:1-768(+)